MDKKTVSEPIDYKSLDINKGSTAEDVPYGNSFGQSAGLKDDLDVEDDSIGKSNFLQI